MLSKYGQYRKIDGWKPLGIEYTFERLTRSGHHHAKVPIRTAARLMSSTAVPHKQSAVNTLLEGAKKTFLRSPGSEQWIDIMWSGLSCWMVIRSGLFKNKTKKQHNRSPEFRSKAILPYTADLREIVKRILEKHRMRTIFKPIIILRTVLSSGKNTVPAGKLRGVVCEIPCGVCEHKYIGETNSPVAKGGYWGLNPPNKAPSPPNWNVKHYKSVSSVNFQSVESPCKNPKPPRKNAKRPYWKLSGDGSGNKTKPEYPTERTPQGHLT